MIHPALRKRAITPDTLAYRVGGVDVGCRLNARTWYGEDHIACIPSKPILHEVTNGYFGICLLIAHSSHRTRDSLETQRTLSFHVFFLSAEKAERKKQHPSGRSRVGITSCFFTSPIYISFPHLDRRRLSGLDLPFSRGKSKK